MFDMKVFDVKKVCNIAFTSEKKRLEIKNYANIE